MRPSKHWCVGSAGSRQGAGKVPANIAGIRLRGSATNRYTCRIACRECDIPLNHVPRTHDTMMRISLIAASLALVIAASAAIAQDAQPPATEPATSSATVAPAPVMPAPVMPAPASDAAVVLAPAPATPAALVGVAARGKGLAYTCRGCHGVTGYKNAYPSYHVPKLGGQSQVYLLNALHEYREGNRKHHTMQAQAESFSEQDIADIAAYLSSIK